MAEESFEERMRRAMGVPTNAETAAKAAEEARRSEAWEKGEPRRDELTKQFREIVAPMLQQALGALQNVLANAPEIEWMISPTQWPPVTAHLPVQQYVLIVRPGDHQRHLSKQARVAPLMFAVEDDERLHVSVPAVQSSPPTASVEFTPRAFDMGLVTLNDIEAAFVDYTTASRKAALKA